MHFTNMHTRIRSGCKSSRFVPAVISLWQNRDTHTHVSTVTFSPDILASPETGWTIGVGFLHIDWLGVFRFIQMLGLFYVSFPLLPRVWGFL